MEKTKSDGLLKAVIPLTFILMVTVNTLAVTLPINGISTAAVSDSFPNLFAPAGLTFSIWGVIYLLLALHTLYQLGLFRSKEHPADPVLLRRVGVLFSLSSLLNSVWIFTWHYLLLPVSMLLMTALLISLIAILQVLHSRDLSTGEKVFVRLPFSVYFGWITVATIANATALLVSLGWNRFGLSETLWAVIILVVGALIGSLSALHYRDVAYTLVLVWAYAGILNKHMAASGFAGKYPLVIVTTGICLAVFVGVMISILIRRNKSQVQPAL